MKNAKIIILAGQSNAVGVGHVKYLPKSYTEAEIKQFTDGYDKILINYTSHDIKSEGFVKTRINCTEKSKDTLGPEVGIAKKLTEKYPDEEFFIVKCAVGGVSMAGDWISPSSGAPYDAEKNAVLPESISDPRVRFPGWCYNEMIKRFTLAVTQLEEMGYTPKVIAMCWMQGESDTGNPATNEPYIGRYDALLKDLRETFPTYFAPDCRYIDAGISEIWGNYEIMNGNKKNYADTHENCFFIDTVAAGLTTKYEPEENPDTAHYDCESTVRLGEMFGELIKI